MQSCSSEQQPQFIMCPSLGISPQRFPCLSYRLTYHPRSALHCTEGSCQGERDDLHSREQGKVRNPKLRARPKVFFIVFFRPFEEQGRERALRALLSRTGITQCRSLTVVDIIVVFERESPKTEGVCSCFRFRGGPQTAQTWGRTFAVCFCSLPGICDLRLCLTVALHLRCFKERYMYTCSAYIQQ